MPVAKTNVTTLSATSATQASADRAQRDAEILRLWAAQWSAKKIAGHVGTRISTVGNVVRKNNAVRKPRGRTITVDLQDAPVEAWQQAMLPELEQLADEAGATNAMKRALVFASLLCLKKFGDLEEFKAWAHQVTGYDAGEITAFVDRGIKGFFIVDGQPSEEAFRQFECDDEFERFVRIMLMAGVFAGTLLRTADDRLCVSDEAP